MNNDLLLSDDHSILHPNKPQFHSHHFILYDLNPSLDRSTPIKTAFPRPLGRSSSTPHLSSKKPKSKSPSLTPSSSPLVTIALHAATFNASSALAEAGLSAGRAMVEDTISWMDSESAVLIVMAMAAFSAISVVGTAW